MSDEYSVEQKRELERLVDGLRSLTESSVALTAPLEVLTEMADAVAKVSERAKGLAGERPFSRFNAPVNGDLNTILPWSPISGCYNPMAPPVHMEKVGDKIVGTATFGLAYEGPPEGVHGAVVAGVYDQVLAFAAMVNGTPGHTAYLTTHYRSITPIQTPLRFETWVERTEGRKIFTKGACYAPGDTLVTEAEALFIEYRSVPT